MHSGRRRTSQIPDARHADGRQKVPSLGRLTALTLLLGGTCLGILGANALQEMGRARAHAADSLLRAAVTAADHMPSPVDFSRPTPLDELERQHLAAAAGANGAAYIVEPARRAFLAEGAIDRIGLDYADLIALGPQPLAGTFRDEKRRVLNIAVRPLSNGQRLIAIAPVAGGAGGIIGRYLAAAFGIVALAGAFLATAARYRRAHAATEAERRWLLARVLGPESAGAGMWMADEEQIALPAAVNAALGQPREDTTTSIAGLRRLIHPEDLPGALGLFLGNGTRTDGTARFRLQSGEWCRCYLRVVHESRPREGIILPITDHGLEDRHGEELIQRLRATLEALPQAFMLWDAHGRLLAWNAVCRELLRIEEGQIRKGMTAREIARIVGVEPRFVFDYFAPPGPDAADAEGLFPNDRFIRVVRQRTVGDGWVCIGNDVTEPRAEAEQRARHERELQATVDILERSRRDLRDALQRYEAEKVRAEEANRAKSEFLANMSHELRTPLNAINGFSELMKEELYGPLGHEKYVEYVRDIHASGHHLLTLINDILDLAKIEAGKLDMHPTQVDLERVLREGLRFIETQMRDSELRLNSSIDHVPTVWADTRAVKQVFINLLSNAEKFTPRGGSVTVTTLVDLQSVTVLVADTGIGMDVDQLGRLGQPFEVVEDHFAKSRRGTGLGISLSKSLIEAQGGILAVASETRRGTVAAFTLPRRPGVVVQLPSMLRDRARILTRTPTEQPTRATANGITPPSPAAAALRLFN